MDAPNPERSALTPAPVDSIESLGFPDENPNPVFRLTRDAQLVYANRASEDLLAGLQVRQGCLGEPWAGRILAALVQGAPQQWEAAVGDPATGRSYRFRCVPVPAAGCVNVYALDITVRERLVQQLTAHARESRAVDEDLECLVEARTAELEAILASVPAGLLVTDLHQIVRANRAALATLGADDLAGFRERAAGLLRDGGLRLAETGGPIEPDQTMMARALRGEQAAREFIICHPITGQETIYRTAIAPVIANGEITGAVALVTDITEGKRTEQRLAYQAMVLDNIFDAVIAFAPNLTITSWNRAAERQYGWTAEEALGSFMPDIVRSQVSEAMRLERLASMAATGRWQGESLHQRRDGTLMHIESTSIAIYDDAGKPAGFVAVNRDITRRKEAEAENARLLAEVQASREELRLLSRRLVSLQEAERRFVADHLVNQAGQVLAALQWQLSAAGPSAEDTRSDEANPLQGTLRGAVVQAMHDLHDLATQLRPMALDFSSLAHVLESNLISYGDTHRVDILFDAGNTEDLEVPREVATALFRAVEDGLGNIAQHAHASAIELTMHRHGDLLTIVLSDDGCGFDSEGPAGHGLGLASMRERMESVNGALQVESGAGGTTLRFQAPLSYAQG